MPTQLETVCCAGGGRRPAGSLGLRLLQLSDLLLPAGDLRAEAGRGRGLLLARRSSCAACASALARTRGDLVARRGDALVERDLLGLGVADLGQLGCDLVAELSTWAASDASAFSIRPTSSARFARSSKPLALSRSSVSVGRVALIDRDEARRERVERAVQLRPALARWDLRLATRASSSASRCSPWASTPESCASRWAAAAEACCCAAAAWAALASTSAARLWACDWAELICEFRSLMLWAPACGADGSERAARGEGADQAREPPVAWPRDGCGRIERDVGRRLHPSMPTGLAVGLAPKDWRYAAVAAIRPRGLAPVGTAPQWFPRSSGCGPEGLGGQRRGILANR